MIDFFALNKPKLLYGALAAISIYIAITVSIIINNQVGHEPHYVVLKGADQNKIIDIDGKKAESIGPVLVDINSNKKYHTFVVKDEALKILGSIILGYLFACILVFYRKQKIG